MPTLCDRSKAGEGRYGFPVVFVAYGSCSKFPPTWCFKRTHLYALTVLEVRICNWFYWVETKVSAEPTPAGGSGRPSLLASSSSEAALLGWWPLPSSSKPIGQLLRVLSLSSSISDLSVSPPSYKDTRDCIEYSRFPGIRTWERLLTQPISMIIVRLDDGHTRTDGTTYFQVSVEHLQK